MTKNRLSLLILLSLILLSWPQAGRATDYSSTDFFLRDPSVGQGGATNSTSTNFQNGSSLSQRAPGRSTSTSFQGQAGFQYYDNRPNNPASLAQYKSDGVTSLAAGSWTNQTTVVLKANVSDPDSTDTLYLCYEVQPLNTGFTNTNQGCGSSVSYSGTAVTASVTVSSGLSTGTTYHWQVQTKDSSGQLSSWVAFGNGSTKDFGVDTVAPTTATVFDGSSTGIESTYNSGSLTSLSANWNAFTDNDSGINKYEYSIGTTSGGTDILGWTNNSTTLNETATGLNLHTNQFYFTNVRATDNAGNVSAVAASSGQAVLPQISFSLSGNTVTFTNLNSANNWQNTQATTLTTSTNAAGGYVITQYAGGLLSSGSTTVPMFAAGSYASPAAWGSTNCAGSSCGFGYTSNDTNIQGANKFNSGTLYAPYSQTAFGDIVADHTAAINGSTGSVSNEQFTVTHKVAITNLQAAKTYTTTIYYVATGTF